MVKLTQVIEIIFNIFCLLFFTYQTCDLVYEYSQDKTMVALEVGLDTFYHLPGVTICPGGILYDKICQLSPNYTEQSELFKSMKEIWVKKGMPFNSILGKIEGGPLWSLKQAIHQDLLSQRRTFSDLFNYTSDKSIVEIGYGMLMDNFKQYGFLEEDEKPLELQSMEESLLYSGVDHVIKKCFTLFSQTNKFWRNKFMIDFISIGMKYDYILHDKEPYHHLSVILHSPNTFPKIHSDTVTYLGFHHWYRLRYSKVTVRKLDMRQHGCKNYLDHSDNFVRSDCIYKCYVERKGKLCNITGVPQSSYLIRSTFMQNENSNYIACADEVMDVRHKLDYIYCLTQCPEECETSYYLASYKVENQWFNRIRFTMTHNEMPDIYINYMFKIDSNTLFCNFGGLMGMWLGLSFSGILNMLKTSLVIFKDKFIKFDNSA